jgi:hypothetical protein
MHYRDCKQTGTDDFDSAWAHHLTPGHVSGQITQVGFYL